MIKGLILEVDKQVAEECAYNSCEDCKYNVILNSNGENLCNAILRLSSSIKSV